MKSQSTPPLPILQPAPTKIVYPELSCKESLDIIRRSCPPTRPPLCFGSGRHHVVILPEAWEELKAMLHYGKRHPANILEKQFQGMSHIFLHKGRITVVVSHFLSIHSANCSSSHTTLIESADDTANLRALSAEREQYCLHKKRFNCVDGKQFDPFLQFGPSQAAVFGHTHPDLGCFFSGPDHAVHRATVDFPAVSLVCDPIRKDFKAMVGVDRESAAVIVCAYASETAEAAAPTAPTLSFPWFAQLQQAFSTALNIRGAQGSFRTRHSRDRKLHIRIKITLPRPGSDKE